MNNFAQVEFAQEELDADDKWIDAIPEDAYAKCPCGCGKKFKFCKDDIEVHEKRFKEKL